MEWNVRLRILLIDPVASTPDLTARALLTSKVPTLGADPAAVRRVNLVELGGSLAGLGHPTTVVLGDLYLGGQTWTLSEGLKVVPARTSLRVPFHPGLFPFTPFLEQDAQLADSDVIQTGEFHQPSTFFACRFGRERGIPVVVWQETFAPMRFPGSLYQLLFEMTAGEVVATVPGQYVPRTTKARDYLRALDIADDRVSGWIPTGIDTDAFSPGPSPFSPSDFGWREGCQILLIAGRLHRAKGVDLALMAVKRALRRNPEVRLIVAGSGPEQVALRRLSVDLGVTDAVRMIGQRPRQDLIGLYNLADLVLCTSRMDLLPFTLIEAGACGRPCVATDVGAVRDIVTDGQSGRVVREPWPEAFVAALLSLLRDAETRARFGTEARRRALAHFSLDRVAKGLLEVYRGVSQ